MKVVLIISDVAINQRGSLIIIPIKNGDCVRCSCQDKIDQILFRDLNLRLHEQGTIISTPLCYPFRSLTTY